MTDHFPHEYLTNDEKLAAEAAFSGRPFNSKWSVRARTVYDGIVGALPVPVVSHEKKPVSSFWASDNAPEESIQAEGSEPERRREEESSTRSDTGLQARKGLPAGIPFKRAIETGALIDVTQTAELLGFSFQVTITKPLWDAGIAPTPSLSQEEQSTRLRDVLMAFRLRLATQPTVSPLIDFPALLAFPPNSVPQPIPLFALIQPDEQNRAMVTLLLPNEISATMIPLN